MRSTRSNFQCRSECCEDSAVPAVDSPVSPAHSHLEAPPIYLVMVYYYYLVSTDDMFNVHLVKRAKVVRVNDSHGVIYSVPLNSSIEFGLVYDPMETSYGSNEALAGQTNPGNISSESYFCFGQVSS